MNKLFDINLIIESSKELNFEIIEQLENLISIKLKEKIILVFENLIEDSETIIYFKEPLSEWHTHGDMFLDTYKTDIELIPYEILKDLKNGNLLISKIISQENTIETSFEYSSQVSNLDYLDSGDEITFIKL